MDDRRGILEAMGARSGVFALGFVLAACSNNPEQAGGGLPEGSDGASVESGLVDADLPNDAGRDTGSGGMVDAARATDSGDEPDSRDSGSAPDAGAAGLVNPAPGSKAFIGANFWNIDWEGQGDFFVSGVDFASATNPWRQELLDDLAPYRVLRFMDWNQTNASNNSQADWSTRKQKTANQNEPVAFEWQIDLCNRTNKDYWLNVPHEANADYWTKLAELVKDQLSPSLRLYVEWSNEVWNGSFPQHAYAASQAGNLGLSGSDAAASYYVYASVRVYEAFESVWGKGNPRLVKVLAGQAAWTGPCDNHLKALADATINPNGTKPDFYAVAPYFSGQTANALQTGISNAVKWITDDVTCAQSGNLPLISYEGGADSYGNGGSTCTTLQHDASMHDLYKDYLDGIFGAGLTGPFMQYTHVGACWGLKEKTSDALASSPKLQGVLDWLAAHP